jgi:hypothetical protein
VIGRENHDAGPVDRWRECLANGGAAVGDLFQTAQASGRLGEFELMPLSRGDPLRVDWPDRFNGSLE